MKSSLVRLFRLIVPSLALALAAHAKTAEVGGPAPDFTLTDLAGQTRSLSDFRGKIVVLEWVNPECPVVHKHYNAGGNIPRLQQKYTGDGVVWALNPAKIEGSRHVPMNLVPVHADQLDPARPVVCVCHHGGRSMQVAYWLERNGFDDVINLHGGIDAWARDVAPDCPRY